MTWQFRALLAAAILGCMAAIPSMAGTVQVRQSCPADPPDPELDTCHATIAAALNWLNAYDTPSAENPGVVDIGPGSFDSISCTGGYSHVTFRGVSRTTTTVGPVGVLNCADLGFETLAVKTTGTGVAWVGTGSSTWKYVDVVANKSWVDSNCDATSATSHAMHGVRWIGALPSDYGARIQCGTIAFELGEIRMTGQGTPPSTSASRYAIAIAGRGKLDVSRSAIRVGSGTWTSSTSWSGSAVAASVGRVFGSAPSGTPTFVLRDSVLNVDLSGIQIGGATAIETVGAQAAVSTPGTGFALARGAASGPSDPPGVRLSVGGNHFVDSKYLWPAASTAPAILSADGADTFVETDCDHASSAAGCSGGANAHVMEYRAAQCGSTDPWFDVVRCSCRSQAGSCTP